MLRFARSRIQADIHIYIYIEGDEVLHPLCKVVIELTCNSLNSIRNFPRENIIDEKLSEC